MGFYNIGAAASQQILSSSCLLYTSIVEIPVFCAKGKTPMRVELQFRTNGMEFWATLEPVSYTHLEVYKRQVLALPNDVYPVRPADIVS